MPVREPREVTESFRIERVLKSSRSGIVFRALDPATGGAVAIKLVPPPVAAAMDACHARFVELAELLTLLQPPGIPPLHDYGLTPDNSAFLVMKLVEGTRLDTLEGLAPARVVGVALGVLDTLATLADRGIQHGNVSPDNVLVGPGDRAWLTGLGTAAMRPSGAVARVVLDGDAAEFAPPERFDDDGGGAADWRGDLYSLALTVCSLLKADVLPVDSPAPTVRLPFDVAKGLRDPNVLRTTLEQSLRRSPDERPPSYDVLRDAFRRALGAAPSTAPPPLARPAAPLVVPLPVDAVPVTGDSSGIDWEEPEGAPAWLHDSGPAFVLEKPEPRELVLPPQREKDEREDTNPVPLQRQAELGIKPKAKRPAVVPTVGAPQPLPTPAMGAPTPAAVAPTAQPVAPPSPAPATPPVPPAPSVPSAPQSEALPPPADMAQRARFRIPPIPAAAPPIASVPAPTPQSVEEPVAPPPPGSDAAAMQAPPAQGRRVDSTPPTGAFELAPVPPPPAAPPPERAAAAVAAPAAPPADAAEMEPAQVPPEPPAEPVGSAAATPQKPRGGTAQPRWLVASLAAVAVVLVCAVGIVVGVQVLRSRKVADVTPTPAPARPRPTSVPQTGAPPAVMASLLTAEQAFSSGDFAGAQAALDTITAEQELALAPTELGRLTRLRTGITRQRLEGVLADLRSGLGNGNLRDLRDAVRRVTRDDEAALAGDPDTAQTLDEARRAVNLFGLASKAQQAGNDSQALQHASALVELVPRSAQAAEMREKAAAGLEQEVDTLVQQGRFAEAQERVATLSRYWSSRPDLAQRLQRVRDAQAADQRLAALLAQAQQAERDRQPDRGLDLLRSATPPAYWEERFRQERDRLQALLQQMDVNPPVVELPSGLKLEYSKNKPFALTIRITDDHGVKSASLFVRVKGNDHYMEVPLSRGPGAEWRGEINPAMHQNKTVEFYVVASDQSGHTGQAGSAEQPLQLKKKWSLFGM